MRFFSSMALHEVLLLLLSIMGVCSCYERCSTTRFIAHIPDWLYSDSVMTMNGMNEAFVDAFNDVYYDDIRTKLEQAKTSEAIPRKKSLPSFDDYSIPSWVYKRVFKHNKPRKFKEKNYVFWDRPIH